MNQPKLSKFCAIIYYIAAIFGFINAEIDFSNSAASRGVMWLCFGIALLCLGSYYLFKRPK